MSYKVTKMSAVRPPGATKCDAPSFQTFEDLEVYRAAREFRKAIYGIARDLPDFEKYGLASQMRRAAVALTNNIAEGHGRFHYPDQIRFMLHSRGSLEELVDDLNVCLDENYSDTQKVEALKQGARPVLALLNGYLSYLRKRSSSVAEPSPGDEPLFDGLPM